MVGNFPHQGTDGRGHPGVAPPAPPPWLWEGHFCSQMGRQEVSQALPLPRSEQENPTEGKLRQGQAHLAPESSSIGPTCPLT